MLYVSHFAAGFQFIFLAVSLFEASISLCLPVVLSVSICLSLCHGFSRKGGDRRETAKEEGKCLCNEAFPHISFFSSLSVSRSVCLPICLCVMGSHRQVVLKGEERRNEERVWVPV